VGRVEPLPDRRGGVGVVVVMVTLWRVVVVVDRLIGLVVILFSQQVGVEVSIEGHTTQVQKVCASTFNNKRTNT